MAAGRSGTSAVSAVRSGRFSEVANVLYIWGFQSVTRTLSAIGSVSASRSVRSERFYCTTYDLTFYDFSLWRV